MQAAALGDATLFWIWTILTSVHFFAFFLAVFAAALNALAVGRPLVPAFRIVSPEPAAMRFFLACMFAYSPLRGIICNTFLS
jgi:hypothetical protein